MLRRAAASRGGGAERSHQAVLRLLACLDASQSWDEYAIDREEARTFIGMEGYNLSAMAGNDWDIMTSQLAAFAHGCRLLRSFAKATTASTAPPVTHRSWCGQIRSAATLHTLCCSIMHCTTAATDPACTSANKADKAKVVRALPALVSAAGVIPAMADACTALTQLLRAAAAAAAASPAAAENEQQQQQQEVLQDIPFIASPILCLFVVMSTFLAAGDDSFALGVAAAMPAMAELAVTTLRCGLACADGDSASASTSSSRRTSSGASSRRSSGSGGGGGSGKTALSKLLVFPARGTTSAATSLGFLATGFGNTTGQALPSYVAGSSSICEAMLMGLGLGAHALLSKQEREEQQEQQKQQQQHARAAAARPAAGGGKQQLRQLRRQQLQQEQQGGSAEQQQQEEQQAAARLPPYREQLLSALGVARHWWRSEQSAGEQDMAIQVTTAVLAVLSSTDNHDLLGVIDQAATSSSSSSSSAGGAVVAGGTQQPGPAAAERLLAPLLLTVLELMLSPSAAAVALHEGMDALQQILLQKGSQRAWTTLPRDVLPALLSHLLPAIERHRTTVSAIRAADLERADEAAELLAAYNQQLLIRLSTLVMLATDAGIDASVPALWDAFRLHNRAFCSVLELSVRAAAGRASTGHSFADSVNCLLCSCVSAADGQGGSSSSSSSNGGGNGRPSILIAAWAAGLDEARLFSLIITTLKGAAVPASSSSSSRPGDYLGLTRQTGRAGNAVLIALSQAVSTGQRGICSTSSSSLGVVLTARCLVTAGRSLAAQQQQQDAASDGSLMRTAWSQLELLRHLRQTVSWLLERAPDMQAAAAAANDALTQQLDALDKQHGHLTQEQVQAAAAVLLSPAVLELAGLLEAFGAAVAAQLPVQHCCNFHGCANLARNSELELVDGKSCVCGGCRVARYCSRECQVAHYKGWHKAVCKRTQQEREQRVQGSAAQQQARA